MIVTDPPIPCRSNAIPVTGGAGVTPQARIAGVVAFFACGCRPDTDPQGADEAVCPGRDDLAANLRVVKIREGRHVVLAGLVDRDVTELRIAGRAVALPAETVPGTTRRPVLLDLDRLDRGDLVQVVVGSKIVEEFDPARGTPDPPVTAPGPAPNGRTVAYLRAITTSGELVVDPAQMLTGRDAVAACNAIGQPDCEIDYEILNPDGHETAAPIADDAAVVLVDWAHCCEQTIRGTVAGLATALRARADAPIREQYRVTAPYWVTVENGVVTRIEEQYLP